MTDHPERCSLGARERQSSFQLGLQDPVFSGQILIPAGAAPGPPYGKLFARLGSFDHLVFTAGKTLQLGSLATYRWCPAGITARLFYRFNILATRHVRVGGLPKDGVMANNSLRRAYATAATNAGVDEDTVGKLLNHGGRSVTSR